MYKTAAFLLIMAACQARPEKAAFEDYLKTHGPEADVLIKGGLVADGSGRQAFRADVLVKDGKTVFVGIVGDGQVRALETLDAAGKYVTPGFIDTHAHGDPLDTPAFENFLAMGATTICLGQDGTSPAQEDLGLWMREVENAMPGPNIAMFVGHNTLRRLSGTGYKPLPAPAELEKMEQLVARAMADGCFGMTTGLEYLPGLYAQEEELLALAKTVGRHGGMIMSHTRNEDDSDVEQSIGELVRQGRHCHVHVSHIKVVYGKGEARAFEILRLLQDARRNSPYPITADIYPYTASFTGIGIVFPDWAKRPNDFGEVSKVRKAELAKYLRERVNYRNGPSATLLGTKPYAGKTLEEVSREKGKPFEQVLIEDIGPEGASGAYFVMNDSLQTALMADSLTMICSDGSPLMRHPRGYGAFARIIEEFVMNRKVFGLEEAVYRMAGLPAKTLGLKDRGLVAPGMAADLLVFDPAKVREKADYVNPHQLAEGFEAVLVNGKPVYQQGRFTGLRAGKMLRKTQQE